MYRCEPVLGGFRRKRPVTRATHTRTMAVGRRHKPHRHVPLHPRSHAHHEKPRSHGWPDHQQRLHLSTCPPTRFRPLRSNETRCHRSHPVNLARWPQIRHRMLANRYRQRSHTHDGKINRWPNATIRRKDQRTQVRRQNRRRTSPLHRQPTPRHQHPIHDNHGNKNALHRPRLTT